MEILTYDPPANAARLRRHPGLALSRAWQILWTFAWFWVKHWFSHQRWLPHRRSELEREIDCARYLTNCLVNLGPTFIKMGQAMSTRPDVLPRTYVQEMTRLQDKVPAYDTRIALATIERELGRKVEEMFPDFDPEPISAASIGQVYKARLRDGSRVVVKVQRPNLPWILSFDLAILRIFARYAQWRAGRHARWRGGRRVGPASVPASRRSSFDLFMKDLPYVAIVDQFGKSLFDQTDFIQEGRNAERFNRSFADFDRVRAPLVYWKYTTRQVITQERIDGVKFNDVPGIERMGVDFRTVVRLGVRALVKQLLEDGFFHADTHPGNIIVTGAGDVVYIDWGMIDTIPRDLQLKLVDMFLHMVRAEYAEFVEDLVDLDMFPRSVDRGLLVPIIEDIYETQLGKRARRVYSMTEVIDRVSDVLYQYPFRLPERFSFLMRTVGTMEGVVLAVWPDFRFLEVALPFAAKLLLTVPDPLIRDRLAGDLVAGGRLDSAYLAETVLLATQETSFQVSEFLPAAVSWLLSDEGERLREAVTDAVLSGDAKVQADLDIVLGVGLRAGDLEPVDAIVPFLRWLGQTPAGTLYRRRVLARLRSLPPHSPLARSAAEVFRLIEPADVRALCEESCRFARVALSDPETAIQPLVDWIADWLEDTRARQAISRLGSVLAASWEPALLDELLDVADLALQRPHLDLRPLVQAAKGFAFAPEAEPWRALACDIVLAGAINGRGTTLLAHLLGRGGLLLELAGAIPDLLLFFISPEGGATRRHLAQALRRRILGERRGARLQLQEGREA
ncbi:MAG: hypothetical protein FJZ01_27265 [Candidatus Sericytochromatia bacterium]|nr:hypothetical protein [Candidatus Tanganyikabacteria bacterium]